MGLGFGSDLVGEFVYRPRSVFGTDTWPDSSHRPNLDPSP
jgi:hypothetical protein